MQVGRFWSNPYSSADADNWRSGYLASASSLPKAGGAIEGIGEVFAFAANLVTSLECCGFGPQLSLSYNSGAGSGLFGFSWALALPQYLDFDEQESDVFVLFGAEDLVPVLQAGGQRQVDMAVVMSRPPTHGNAVMPLHERATHIEALAQDMLDYLRAHPDACNTARGFCQWWIPRQRLNQAQADVQEALELLCERGRVGLRTDLDGMQLYRARGGGGAAS